MPDWFYRTVSQPILFRLTAPRARDLALGFMGRLSRLPFGPLLIDFLGHMRADPRLRHSLLDTTFPTVCCILVYQRSACDGVCTGPGSQY